MKRAKPSSAIIGIMLLIGTGGFAFAQAAPNLSGYFVAVDGQGAIPDINAIGSPQWPVVTRRF